MASLIWATAVVITSFSWVSSFLIAVMSVASARFDVVGGAKVLVGVPVPEVDVVAVEVEFPVLVVDCVISDDVSES